MKNSIIALSLMLSVSCSLSEQEANESHQINTTTEEKQNNTTVIKATVLNQIQGVWTGTGNYIKGAAIQQCREMELSLAFQQRFLLLSYQFICRSFVFTDEISLTRSNNIIFQRGQQVGTITPEGDDTIRLTLNNIRFKYFTEASTHITMTINISDNILIYQDKTRTTPTESFHTTMKKKLYYHFLKR